MIGQTTNPPQPTFMIRHIPIYGDLILSPMAGFSDKPYRLICREYGSAMSYTEFVSVDGILHDNERTHQMLDFAPTERPMTFQIFGSDEAKIEEAARRIEELGPDIIDLNMGCSVPKVSGRGAGAALLALVAAGPGRRRPPRRPPARHRRPARGRAPRAGARPRAASHPPVAAARGRG
ncbi:MAG: tRNA-dihydrouridine synthase family protein, partial [Chloroflexi bacterium]|nr:tRNA-dihydrouridine synthase family protein [Chloroflexota bacterium]